MKKINFVLFPRNLKFLLFTLFFVNGIAFESGAQVNVWSDIPASSLAGKRSAENTPLQFRSVSLNQTGLQNLLASVPKESNVTLRNSAAIFSLPTPDGAMESFRIVESPIMEQGLADKFPEIKTYTGQGIDDPTATIRFGWTFWGFHAIIIKPDAYIFIEPNIKGNLDQYIVYSGSDMPVPMDLKVCGIPAQQMARENTSPINELASGTQLRTYRMAVAATGEFTNANGGTVPLALSAVVTIVNQDDAIYEREVAVRFVLVANNNKIIFTNAATDPYTNTAGSPCSTPIRSENQTACDDSIGNANYDIGHVFTGTNIGGCASIGSICGGNKGWGASGVGYGNAVFDVSLSCHEMGHQHGANHTFNSNNGSCLGAQYSASTAYEPGSGSTIMSYAGSCQYSEQQGHVFSYY